MTGVKRTDDVLLAFKELRDRGVDAALCLVGDGPDRDAVEERAYELGIARHCFSSATRTRSPTGTPPSTSSSSRRRTRARR